MAVILGIATVLNIAIDLSPLIAKCIKAAIWQIAKETLRYDPAYIAATNDKNRREELINIKVSEMGGDELFGRTIGLVEKELYIYSLAYGIPQLIQGVLVFKGFSGWVGGGTKVVIVPSKAEHGAQEDAAQKHAASGPNPGEADPEDASKAGAKTLAHYYGYTVGNLISIAFALMYYQAGRLLYYHVLIRRFGWPH